MAWETFKVNKPIPHWSALYVTFYAETCPQLPWLWETVTFSSLGLSVIDDTLEMDLSSESVCETDSSATVTSVIRFTCAEKEEMVKRCILITAGDSEFNCDFAQECKYEALLLSASSCLQEWVSVGICMGYATPVSESNYEWVSISNGTNNCIDMAPSVWTDIFIQRHFKHYKI